MEFAATVSHGASSFLMERLMFVSDAYQTAFCRTCGNFAVWNPNQDPNSNIDILKNQGSYLACRMCGDSNNFGRATIPYSYKLLIQLLASANINLRPDFLTFEEYTQKLFSKERKGESGEPEYEDDEEEDETEGKTKRKGKFEDVEEEEKENIPEEPAYDDPLDGEYNEDLIDFD